MGNQGNLHALVAMTNKDVYYISLEAADLLAGKMATADKIFITTDVKSGARLRLHIPNISSIVIDQPRVKTVVRHDR